MNEEEIFENLKATAEKKDDVIIPKDVWNNLGQKGKWGDPRMDEY